jgi:hypothetical protein
MLRELTGNSRLASEQKYKCRTRESGYLKLTLLSLPLEPALDLIGGGEVFSMYQQAANEVS